MFKVSELVCMRKEFFENFQKFENLILQKSIKEVCAKNLQILRTYMRKEFLQNSRSLRI